MASPPAATPTPPPAPAADAPAIPPPPVLESTPWDAEVEALARAIDLADRVRAIAKRGEPDADATLREAEALTAEAGRLRVAAIAVEASLARPTGRGTERRIFYADEIQAGTTKALRGVSSSVLEKLSLGAFPPETARQVALLAARFEIAQAAQALVASPLGQSDRVRKVLREEIQADGWPSPEPFDQWLFRHRRNGSMSASEAERFMADQFATRLTNLKGMKGLVRELRRICPASGVSPSAPSPAPAASP